MIIMLRIVGVLICVIFIGIGWGQLYKSRMAELPSVQVLQSIKLEAPSNPSVGFRNVQLGYVELGQRPGTESAERNHIRLIWDENGAVFVQHIAATLRLGLRFENIDFGLTDRMHILADGDSFTVGDRSYKTRINAANGELQLSYRDEASPLVTIPKGYYKTQDTAFDWISSQLSIGGRVGIDADEAHGPNDWDERFSLKSLPDILINRNSAPPVIIRQPDIAAGTVRISREDDGNFVLRASPARLITICAADGDCFELGRQLWPLQGDPLKGSLTQLTIGRTSYGVQLNGDTVVLKPRTGSHWLSRDAAGIISAEVSRLSSQAFTYSRSFQRGLSEGSLGLNQDVGTILSRTNIFTSIPLVFVFVALWRFRQRPATWYRVLFIPAILSFALAPGVATLPSSPVLSPIDLTAIISALIVGLLLVLPLRIPTSMKHEADDMGARSTVNRYRRLAGGILIAAAAMLFIYVALLTSNKEISVPGAGATAAMFAVIALFALACATFALMTRTVTAFLFWTALSVLVAIGSLATAHLVFGQTVGRYTVLFDRHLAALGLIGAAGAIFASFPSAHVTRFSRVMLSWAGNVFRIKYSDAIVVAYALAVVFLIGSVLVVGPFPVQFRPAYGLGEVPIAAWAGVLLVIGLVLFLSFKNLPWLGWMNNKTVPVNAWPFVLFSFILGCLVLVTPETGIFGIQPSEAAKSVLAILLAVFIARFVEHDIWRMPFDVPQSITAPFLTFMFLVAMFIIGSAINFDFSPAAIIALMLGIVTVLLVCGFAASSAPGWVFAIGAPLAVFGIYFSAVFFALLGLLLSVIALTVGFGPASGGFLKRRRNKLSVALIRGRRPESLTLSRRINNWRRQHLSWRTMLPAGVFVVIGLVGLFATANVAVQATYEELKDYRYNILGLIPLPQTPLERVLSWRDAGLVSSANTQGGNPVVEFPDLSLQVRESREIIAATGCRGSAGPSDANAPSVPLGDLKLVGFASNSVGLFRDFAASELSLCQGRGVQEALFPQPGPLHPAVLSLPAVQDDFAPTLVIASLGLEFAVLLLGAQLVLMGCVVALALRLWSQLGRFSAARGMGLLALIFLCAMSVILFTQFALAWGNVFGLLPVVGQPMTFVALGASHHLFFALPFVVSFLFANSISNNLAEVESRPGRVFFGQELRRSMTP